MTSMDANKTDLEIVVGQSGEASSISKGGSVVFSAAAGGSGATGATGGSGYSGGGGQGGSSTTGGDGGENGSDGEDGASREGGKGSGLDLVDFHMKNFIMTAGKGGVSSWPGGGGGGIIVNSKKPSGNCAQGEGY